ncbi:cell division transport system ATP-binding protein [Enterococcus sp. DIV2371]
MKKDNFILMDKLGVEHKNNKVLKSINLKIEQGEFVFLIGASGSGKTTLIELIQGRRMYSTGSLKIYDKELSQYNYMELQDLRKMMGVVFQDTRLFEEWTVFENIAYKLKYLGYPLSFIQSKVEEVTIDLKIDRYIKSSPKNLSGGERQRVNIARAIVANPKIIIADEPTSNLDKANAKIVFELLKKMNRLGSTVIMSTHDPNFIEESKFRIVKLTKGEKVYDQCGANYFI